MLTAVSWMCALGWLAATILNQFESAGSRIRKFDVLNIVPRWTFFAPEPGRTDFHLLYRDAFDADQYGPWREIYPVMPRDLLTALWNPSKRYRKAIVDLANGLLIQRPRTSDDVLLQLPYLAFLNIVSHYQMTQHCRGRQFALVTTNGPLSTDVPHVLLRSELHRVSIPADIRADIV